MFFRVRPRGCQLRGKLPQGYLKVADLVLQLVDPLGLLPDDSRCVLLSGHRPVNRVVALQFVVGLFQVP